jgi:hypothetical protein
LDHPKRRAGIDEEGPTWSHARILQYRPMTTD